MSCPACGHPIPERAKFCNECGAAVASRCAGCGAELPPAAKFCNECGCPTGGPAPKRTETERPPRVVLAYTPKHLADRTCRRSPRWRVSASRSPCCSRTRGARWSWPGSSTPSSGTRSELECVGRTRPRFEFLGRCRARGITVRTATGVPHGRAVPLRPILEFYREVFGSAPDDSDAQTRQKNAGSVARTAPEELASLPRLFDFMHAPAPANCPPDLTPDERLRAVMALLRRLAAARAAAERGVELASAIGFRHAEAANELALARALIAGGDAAAAESALAHGSELTAALDARDLLPHVEEARAELAQLRGDAAGREHALRTSARMHRENGEEWQATQAEARIGA